MSIVTVETLRLVSNDQILLDIAFEIKSSLALVGESGSGKSLTLKALMGLLDNNLHLECHRKSDFEWGIGNEVGFVPQNPFTALSPLTRIKDQLFMDSAKAAVLFTQLGLDTELLERFPPELSGGQLQRVVIAIALSTSPKILLLDEPTTALDSNAKEAMITLLKDLQKQLGFLILFVTHDIKIAASICEYISVMRNGHIIEYGLMQEVITAPKDTYTQSLIDAEFTTRGFRL